MNQRELVDSALLRKSCVDIGPTARDSLQSAIEDIHESSLDKGAEDDLHKVRLIRSLRKKSSNKGHRPSILTPKIVKTIVTSKKKNIYTTLAPVNLITSKLNVLTSCASLYVVPRETDKVWAANGEWLMSFFFIILAL